MMLSTVFFKKYRNTLKFVIFILTLTLYRYYNSRYKKACRYNQVFCFVKTLLFGIGGAPSGTIFEKIGSVYFQ